MAASMRMSHLVRLSVDTACNTSTRHMLNHSNRLKPVAIPARYLSFKFNYTKNIKLSKILRVISAASVGTFGFAYVIRNNWWPTATTVNAKEDKDIVIPVTSAEVLFVDENTARPQHTPIRSIKSEHDASGLKLTLYQYQTCPFCCKVRAFLDFYGFSYDVVEVNSVWRTELKWTKYPKVPVLVCEGISGNRFLQVNDSSVIISALESFLEDRGQTKFEDLVRYYPAYETKVGWRKVKYEYPNRYFIMFSDREMLPKTLPQLKEEREWRKWVDDWLVHTLSPNVYRTRQEALQAFNYFSEVGEWEKVFSSLERSVITKVGALAMYFVGKSLKKKYSLKEDVRESLYDACNEWTEAIGKHRRFMGGNRPNLADLSVYGTLLSIEGCDAFQDLLIHTEISRWFYEMKTLVNTHAGAVPTNYNRNWTVIDQIQNKQQATA